MRNRIDVVTENSYKQGARHCSHDLNLGFVQVIAQVWILLLGGLGASYLLDVWVCPSVGLKSGLKPFFRKSWLIDVTKLLSLIEFGRTAYL